MAAHHEKNIFYPEYTLLKCKVVASDMPAYLLCRQLFINDKLCVFVMYQEYIIMYFSSKTA